MPASVVLSNTCNFPMYSERDDIQWRPFFSALQRRLRQQEFETWFRPLRLSRNVAAQSLQIAAPNILVKEWILSRYSSTVSECLRESNLDGFRVEWMPLVSAAKSPVREPHESDSSPRPENAVTEFAPSNSSPLNENYTFEKFVVAPCNRLAHAAAKAVTDTPGKTYNPLYLYGGVGLGKTHLLQAIGHEVVVLNSSLRIAYLSLERFMNELITAIRYGSEKTNAFRDRYRRIDVLLIDDVQFIAGKDRTQEEFFHTFNTLYDQQKQIVMTSDCPPKDIAGIEERLHSRFEWGLIADIQAPDLETKIAIVKRKAEFHRVEIPDDVAHCLAKSSKHNIRELEGSLIRLLAMASLRGSPVTKALAEESLRVVTGESSSQNISIDKIQKAVAAHYKIDPAILKARSSVRGVLVPRQIGMFLCKRLTKESYPEIARQFGGKHHTTVIHSVDKIEKSIQSNRELATTVTRLIDHINN